MAFSTLIQMPMSGLSGGGGVKPEVPAMAYPLERMVFAVRVSGLAQW